MRLAIKFLRAGRLSPMDLLSSVLDPRNQVDGFRAQLFATGDNRLADLLNLVMEDPKGKGKVVDWMRPHAVDIVCEDIDNEMKDLSASFSMNVADAMPEFLSNWTLKDAVITPAQTSAPKLLRILTRAAQTD
jgi:hypothetical protein